MLKHAKWICAGQKNPKDCTLPPEVYKKSFILETLPESARLTITALGIYEARINGTRVGEDYFTPGYTNYKSHIQVQKYDVLALLHEGENTLEITVANGWYLGRIGNKYNVYGDRRALIAMLDMGDNNLITDESWLVSFDGEVRFADFYDGETVDNRIIEHTYAPVKLFDGFTPKPIEQIGTLVRQGETLMPRKNGEIYDFGENFAGTVRLKVKATEGTVIKIRCAEILVDGKIFTDNYRSAKNTLTFICREGEQTFDPRFTYTGFRYVTVNSDRPIEILSLEGVVLYSDMEQIGEFSCSDERLNKLQACIVRNQKSNFMDIPTDCPQRDERLGWTGDIGTFSSTACFNFDTSVFFKKYLYDMKSEQAEDGAIPAAIPSTGMYEPRKYPIPLMMWGDASVIIPWNVYQAYGDENELSACYDMMKNYVLCERSYAESRGFGYKKYLWNKNPYQFGDWCAFGKNWYHWTKRGKHLATLWYYNSVCTMIKASRVLGRADDEKLFSELSESIKNAFVKAYLKDDGTLKNADFESMYVCALAFGIIPDEKKDAVIKRLVHLVEKKDYKVMTGFPGTPYLLFVLADNGYEEVAFKVLTNEACPGWLHMVKQGATTLWERWDAIEEDGSFFHGGAGMVSFNHYALAVVGDFLYKRVLGLEPIDAGYKKIRVKPLCGDLSFAEGSLVSPYGKIGIKWQKCKDLFTIEVDLPEDTETEIIMPNGEIHTVYAGNHSFQTEVKI